MHKLFLPTLIAATLCLAACNSSNQGATPGKTQATQAALPTAVSGTVSLRTPGQLSPAAKLQVQLTNVTVKPPALTAEVKDVPVSQMPANFQIDFNPATIDQAAFYVVEATVVDGERRYVSARQYPVLTKGAPAKVDIQVNPEPTPAEVVEEEYRLLERAVGGMKRVQGASEDDNSTTAWDGFFDKKGLRYIREITDLGDKGRVNTFFGYREDGRPFMVVKENVPAMSERANAAVRAGWSDKDVLVLKTKRDGAKTDVLSDADAKALRDKAQAMYDVVSKRKP